MGEKRERAVECQENVCPFHGRKVESGRRLVWAVGVGRKEGVLVIKACKVSEKKIYEGSE